MRENRYWQSGHYRSAVEDAAKKVNAETQNKVGRRDVSETKLFQEAFSADAPVAGRPRLRRMTDDGSDTYKSVQRGAMALAADPGRCVRCKAADQLYRAVAAQGLARKGTHALMLALARLSAVDWKGDPEGR